MVYQAYFFSEKKKKNLSEFFISGPNRLHTADKCFPAPLIFSLIQSCPIHTSQLDCPFHTTIIKQAGWSLTYSPLRHVKPINYIFLTAACAASQSSITHFKENAIRPIYISSQNYSYDCFVLLLLTRKERMANFALLARDDKQKF